MTKDELDQISASILIRAKEKSFSKQRPIIFGEGAPTLYVIAGPNDIGKTTSSYDVVPKNTPVINSDEIAKEARIAGLLTLIHKNIVTGTLCG